MSSLYDQAAESAAPSAALTEAEELAKFEEWLAVRDPRGFIPAAYSDQACKWKAWKARAILAASSGALAVPDSDKSRALESLLESAEIMMKWCIKNVNSWSFSEYDWLKRDVERVRKFIPAAPATPAQGQTK